MLRRRFAPLALAVLVASPGCSREPDEPTLEMLAEAAGVTPLAVAPRFGGQPVLAGARVVEVLPREDGEIEAEVRDAAAEPIAGAKLTVKIAGPEGAQIPVAMRYDGRTKRYVGSAPEGVTIAPGPIEVEVAPRGGDVTVGSAPMVAVASAPAHGGQVVLLGPHAPEIRLGVEGTVHAYVPTESGKLPSGELYAHVPVEEGEPVRVELEYDGDEAAYVARVGKGVVLVPGPVELELVVGNTVHRGRVAEVIVAPRPALGGQVVVAGDYGVEVVPVDGELRANLYDRRGVLVEDRPPTIVVRAEGHPGPVRLRWNASAGYYVAPLPPNVTVSAAPVRVEVRHRGRHHHGSVRVHPAHGVHPGRRGHRGHPVHAVHPGHGRPHHSARVEVVAPAPRVDVRVSHPGVSVHVDDGHRRHKKHHKRHEHRKVDKPKRSKKHHHGKHHGSKNREPGRR